MKTKREIEKLKKAYYAARKAHEKTWEKWDQEREKYYKLRDLYEDEADIPYVKWKKYNNAYRAFNKTLKLKERALKAYRDALK